MPSKIPVLLPIPRHTEWGPGHVELTEELFLVITSNQPELLPAALRFKRAVEGRLGIAVNLVASPSGLVGRPSVELIANAGEVSHPQGYSLSVRQGGIRILAGTAEGASYGLTTLKQIMFESGRRIPEVEIHDFPDFARRGVMLDISRGKVPTMETMYNMVDMLADLKINEFQLYTEHTFAYQNHREVWQNYSPMTGEEILVLDRFCRERFIDLVPNQNSFGHLTPWLSHERYVHMAEAPGGWTLPNGSRYDGPFSLCPLEPTVAPFLSELYDELLPHFSSRYFNVGCDETFDLGQGRSKEAVERFGEHRVYLDLLLMIYEQVKARGKTMQFWGDIIIKAPQYIAELPKDVVALEWGYEAEHPFDLNCGHFAKAGVPFYVCPGTSTWNTLVGRTDNAIGNMRNAAESGLKHGAVGYLNTIWGDRGHQDYQPVTYLGIAYGAAVSWTVENNREADVRPYLDRHILMDPTEHIGAFLYDLGNVYKAVGKTPRNASVLGALLHQGFEQSRAIEDVTAADLDRAAGHIRQLAARLGDLAPTCADAALVLQELRNGIRMLLHACQFGKVKLDLMAGKNPEVELVKALAKDLTEICAEHRDLWLARNRIGGLEEMSLAPLRRILDGYRQLALR